MKFPFAVRAIETSPGNFITKGKTYRVTGSYIGKHAGAKELYEIAELDAGATGSMVRADRFIVTPHGLAKGDKVRYNGGSGWRFLNGKVGHIFTVHDIRLNQYDPGSGQYYVQLAEGLADNPTHTQLPSLFERIEDEPSHPPVKYEDLLASNHANRRKRKQLKLQAEQISTLRKELREARSRNANYIAILADTQKQLRVAQAANSLFMVQSSVTSETRGPIEPAWVEGVRVSYAAPKGHAGQSGGLQAHSIGDEYPYIVVGKQENADSPVYYQILDAESGNYYWQRYAHAAVASQVIGVWKAVDKRAAKQGEPRAKINAAGSFSD